MRETEARRAHFVQTIREHQSAFDLRISDESIERLADYYQLVQQHNPLLHLVAPCPPEEFAVRHILESLTLLEFLPLNARFADIGAGAGLPSIPCLLVSEDLNAVLVESKEKKAKFLTEAASALNISDRAQIVNRQFEEVTSADFSFVTCRALDKFIEKLPRLLKWAKLRTLLLFGGNSLDETLQKEKICFERKLIPMSEQRFLFIVQR